MKIDKRAAYLAFLNDPDQLAREAELQIFFGPHAEIFLASYQKIRSAVVREESGEVSGGFGKLTFEWAAFWLGFCWLMYRKMWLFAAVFLGLIIASTFIPIPIPGLIVGIAIGFAARRLYIWHSITTIQSLRQPDGTVSEDLLRINGGVSILAGTISGIAILLIVAFAIFAGGFAAHTGQPIRR